jgi:hypothetical protein
MRKNGSYGPSKGKCLKILFPVPLWKIEKANTGSLCFPRLFHVWFSIQKPGKSWKGIELKTESGGPGISRQSDVLAGSRCGPVCIDFVCDIA